MGQKSANVEGFSHLGIRVKKVEFRAPNIFPWVLACSVAKTSFSPTRSKKTKKNSTCHPSGPGLLSFLNPFSTALTSSIDMGLRKQSISSSVVIFEKSLITLSWSAIFADLSSPKRSLKCCLPRKFSVGSSDIGLPSLSFRDQIVLVFLLADAYE